MSRHLLPLTTVAAALLSLLIVCSCHKTTVAPPATTTPQPRGLIPLGGIPTVETLPQHWTDAEANWFYNIPQGSKLIPYTWFLHLEQAGTQKLFRDTENMQAMGYLPRRPDSLGNPDGLPIGFVKDVATDPAKEEAYLGFTCAACHTNQINYKGKAYLIDGAPTLADHARFQRELAAAMNATLQDTSKFDRFASAVGAPDKVKLRAEMKEVAAFRNDYLTRNFPGDHASEFGPGRVDAFGAILNEVGATFAQSPGNYVAADAPVSYPFLWDTPQHDKVQWNGAAENTVDHGLVAEVAGTPNVGALGRNVGEVLGVFGKVDTSNEGSVLQLFGYLSSVKRTNLIGIETLLVKLWSPQMPAEISTSDPAQVAAGRALFTTNCSRCHDDIKRDDPNRTVTAKMADVATDPRMAQNFATRVARSGILKGRVAQFPYLARLGATERSGTLLEHVGQRVVLRPEAGGAAIQNVETRLAALDLKPVYSVQAEIKIGENKISGRFQHLEFDANNKVMSFSSNEPLTLKNNVNKTFRQDLIGVGKLSSFKDSAGNEMDIGNTVRATPATGAGSKLDLLETPATFVPEYKGRPLNGIWATGPYLHNGSVRTLDELLKPAAAREPTFHMGSREFDPDHVGFTNEGSFLFDTALPGNSNAGHEYGPTVFTEQERKQLIAYIKTL